MKNSGRASCSTSTSNTCRRSVTPGNDFEFAAVDDFSREAVVSIRTDQTSAAAAAFLEHVVATLPVSASRRCSPTTRSPLRCAMRSTPSGSPASSKSAPPSVFAITYCVPTRRNRTGKSSASFRTVNDECLHVRPLFTFAARSRAVDDFVWFYNHERPHFSLGGMTPVIGVSSTSARLSETYVLVQHHLIPSRSGDHVMAWMNSSSGAAPMISVVSLMTVMGTPFTL